MISDIDITLAPETASQSAIPESADTSKSGECNKATPPAPLSPTPQSPRSPLPAPHSPLPAPSVSPLRTPHSALRTSFSLPSSDLDLFASMNARARNIVQRRLRSMRVIHTSATPWSGCLTVAAMFHGERGWSAKRLHQIYLDYTESGDWRVLVDAAVAGPAWQNQMVSTGLPEKFLEHLCQMWAQNQRDKFASVYNKLLAQYRQWRAGDTACAIPGYDHAPEPDSNSVADLPVGWTYSNLKTAVNKRASKYARKLIQIGPKNASSLGPQVITTRAGLRPGQYYILDDSWNDFKCIAFGQSVRLLAFHVLDLYSGCNVARGYKPALRDEKETEERLKEREMIWLLVKFLTTEGYHPAGCTIIAEKSTATVRKREREILDQMLSGIIKVETGPSGGGPGIRGLFTGPGGGNPRWKAPLESWFNLLRNRTADMIEFPAQTGSNSRLNLPEGMPGIEKDTLALVKAFRAMCPEKAELARLGMLPYTEAIFRLDAITEVINCRTDHSLEGWRECGHYITEFRIHSATCSHAPGSPLPASPWVPSAKLLDYDPAERDAVAAYLANTPASKRERPLSPREVFDAGKSDLVKLPLAVAAMLIDELPGIERPVKNNTIEISVPEVDPDEPLCFGLTRRDGRGIQDPLRNDDKWFVRVNPIDPRVAWLYSADGKFAGVAPYYGRITRGDVDARNRAFAAKRKALAPMIEEGRRLAANITADATDRAAHTTAILGPTPAETTRQRQSAEARSSPESTAAANDILSSAAPPDETHAADDLLGALTGAAVL